MPSSSQGTLQRTLRVKVSVEGVGLHTGRSVRLTLAPAAVDTGITFVRADLPHAVEIPARADCVVDTTLNTTLGRDGARVGTVEHLLAALYALGVDNVRVELDGPEVPILDGSAAPFAGLIDRAGVREQKAARKVAFVRRPVVVQDGDKEVRLTPASTFSVHCAIDFRHPLITDQKFGLELGARAFLREIATARTFGFVREVPEGLRFPDEFVRHKILDAIGDLALFGMPVIGALHAHKTGHALNHRLVRKLQTEAGAVEIVTLPEPASRRPAQEAVELPLGLEGSLA
jgi:UDP-3-O-[3-hydroxymyristoyl] N-acetylglucosamine deacetylase